MKKGQTKKGQQQRETYRSVTELPSGRLVGDSGRVIGGGGGPSAEE